METIETTGPRMRKLTVAEAADQWEAASREITRLTGLREQAAIVLHAHFDRTGRTTYRNRIARRPTGGMLVLDQPKIRAYLGAKLGDFQKRTERGWTLVLLK